jgi:hypothetical protein
MDVLRVNVHIQGGSSPSPEAVKGKTPQMCHHVEKRLHLTCRQVTMHARTDGAEAQPAAWTGAGQSSGVKAPLQPHAARSHALPAMDCQQSCTAACVRGPMLPPASLPSVGLLAPLLPAPSQLLALRGPLLDLVSHRARLDVCDCLSCPARLLRSAQQCSMAILWGWQRQGLHPCMQGDTLQ